MRKILVAFISCIGILLGVLIPVVTSQISGIDVRLSEEIGKIDLTLRGGEGTRGILERLAVIEQSLGISSSVPVSSEGGDFSLRVLNPSTQEGRTIDIEAPGGWVSEDTELTIWLSGAPVAALPKTYKQTGWNFVLASPVGFSEAFHIFTEFTKEELEEAGVPEGSELAVLQWFTEENWWSEVESDYVHGSSYTLRATLRPSKLPVQISLVSRK